MKKTVKKLEAKEIKNIKFVKGGSVDDYVYGSYRKGRFKAGSELSDKVEF